MTVCFCMFQFCLMQQRKQKSIQPTVEEFRSMLAEQSLYFTVALCYNHFEEERSVTVMSVGENIAYFRKKLGLTQEMLSERIGVTAQAVSKWENGVSHS